MYHTDHRNLSRFWSFCCILLLSTSVHAAGNPPVQVTNAYFTSALSTSQNDTHKQPVARMLPANHVGTKGYFVLDLLLHESGTHKIQISIADDDNTLLDEMHFQPIQVTKPYGGDVYTIISALSGGVPEGLLNLVISDRIDQKIAYPVGHYAILTRAFSVQDALKQHAGLPTTPTAHIQKKTTKTQTKTPSFSCYTVRLGVFFNQKHVHSLKASMQNHALPGYFEAIEVKGKSMWLLGVGPFKQRQHALKVRNQIGQQLAVEKPFLRHIWNQGGTVGERAACRTLQAPPQLASPAT
ncbi:SPOR domain-containing protein [Magnetococcus sp. PR-3]|uniref:SPOR domain-containing protein n=1 Tax=Magnetococcus sp. PR-3 TaxID=3120355 RepID=UPI002FCE170C